MKKTVLCLAVIIFMGLASAEGFTLGKNYSYVEENYVDGDVIRGMLNISFDKQENLPFTSTFGEGKKITEVFDAMNLTRGIQYNCEPASCKAFYEAYSAAETKDISLKREEQIFGFQIKQDRLLKSVEGLEFAIDVNAEVDCESQVYVDLFDDGTTDFYNTRPYTGSGNCGSTFYPNRGANYGCFDDEEEVEETFIGTDMYCELMKDVPASAAYEIGGNIGVKKSGGQIGFLMIPQNSENCDYDLFGGFEEINSFSGKREFSVAINYSSNSKFNAYVCVYTDEASASSYFTIGANTDKEEYCGVAMTPGDCPFDYVQYGADYELFIRPKGYDAVNEVFFDSELYEEATGRNLKKDLTEYVNITYGMNCSGTNGCVIPFSVKGAEGEDQSIHSVTLRYQTNNLNLADNKIQSIREKPAKIRSGYLKIPLEKIEIEVPQKNGKHTFELSLGGKSIIKKIIDVSIGFAFDLTPRFAFISQDTYFNAKTNMNVSYSKWDFGDGSTPITVTGSNARHTYSKAGEYTITVTLVKTIGTQQNSTKRFKVLVGDADESAELAIKDYELRIQNLEESIGKYPAWIKQEIYSTLALETKKAAVRAKRTEFDGLSAGSPDSNYIAIIDGVYAIDLPYSVYTNSAGTLPADVGYNRANPTILEDITGQAPGNPEETKAKIFAWMNQHYDVKIDFEIVSAQTEGEDWPVLKKYKVNFVEKVTPQEEAIYLVIGYPKSSLIFSSGVEKFDESLTGGTYTELKNTQLSSVEFLISGPAAPDAIDLGLYISPAPQDLGVDEREIVKCWLDNCDPEGNFLWGTFITGIGIILFLFFATYILLQTWYKKNYERHLFPNPNDLYNVLNFIYNSRRNGLKDEETKKGLKQKKWTGEQITYSFKKLEGKRTGMWEIPVFKFVENRKVRRELEKKQGRPVDIRFIKRPNL